MELWQLTLIFVGLLLVRMPIAYAMMAVAGLFLWTAGTPVSLLVQRIAGGLDSFPLLAVPLFLLAGSLMNAMGVTDRIFQFASAVVRHVPGGLGHVNVVASVIFAGMSGSIIADAGGLGKVEIRAMNDAGYDRGFSAAITAASAIIGPIIPPSIVMVIYAFLTDVSIARLFVAGLLPGLLLALTMMAAVFILAVRRPADFPTMPRASQAEVWVAFRGAILPLLAPVILVGGIVSGYFTPTESGAVAVLYVLLIGTFYLRFDRRSIFSALEETLSITASTLLILAAAGIFSWIVATQNFPVAFADFFQDWVHSRTAALLIIIAIVVLLGMVMEGIPIMVVFMPTFLAVAEVYGIDPIHLGIIVLIGISMGALTPPVGITLYLTMAIAGVGLPRFMRAIWPFYLAVLVAIGLIAVFPAIVLWLPSVLL